MFKNPIKYLIFIFFLFFSNDIIAFSYKPIHEFEIYRNNKKIGFHKLSFKNIEDKIVVNTQIEMIVKLGIIPVFTYFYKGEELWVNNNFIRAKTITKKNNKNFKFEAERKNKKMEIKSRGKVFFEDSDSLITSYWNQNWMKKKVLIDSQHGKKRLINVEKKNYEKVKTVNGDVFAQRFKVTGTQDKPNGKKIDYDIWYDEEGRWVKIIFKVKKSFIEYFLVTKY
ncbi:MAG: hypothetical protein CMI97_05840 [Pelagibacteraceae bacterium]|nr:hypothetical protein [Pelagibacteraceae bacterium]